MIWKTIGQSVIGLSHQQSGKGCEDAQCHRVVPLSDDDEALICFVSDGAGSARFAEQAAATAVQSAAQLAGDAISAGMELTEQLLMELAEHVYDVLEAMAEAASVPKNEFSCTLLGCIILPEQTGFLQIGDGAIIRNNGSGHFSHIWWPQNGEYQNTTTFLIDDANLPNLKVKVVDEVILEVGLFTDGLQMLTLNNETLSVHQPFFNNLFPLLRKAEGQDHLNILNGRLNEYLSGPVINGRTDDDKTLLLATRL